MIGLFEHFSFYWSMPNLRGIYFPKELRTYNHNKILLFDFVLPNEITCPQVLEDIAPYAFCLNH